jgi:hypothetical protein
MTERWTIFDNKCSNYPRTQTINQAGKSMSSGNSFSDGKNTTSIRNIPFVNKTIHKILPKTIRIFMVTSTIPKQIKGIY